ncbi:MAG: type II secretion system protein GspJ [Pseudomonadota bacterium]|nr:type II secretion system protein GspJ [Pseudomonadota bacterium]
MPGDHKRQGFTAPGEDARGRPLLSPFLFHAPRAAGFTLVELLIAVFILTVVTSTIYTAYRGTFRLISETEYEGEVYESARAVMTRLQQDLGALSSYKGEFLFVAKRQDMTGGDFMEVSFLSAAHIEFDADEPQGGIAAIRYLVEEDKYTADTRAAGEGPPSYRLVRVDALFDNRPRDAAATPQGFALCEHIQSFAWKFYDPDGKEHETWDSGGDAEGQKKRAPAVVEVRLDLANPRDRERPYRFSTRFHLPVNRVDPDGYPNL